MRELPARDSAGAALAAGAVVLLSFAEGGFFPNAWRAGAVAFFCAGGLAILLGGAHRPSRSQVLVVGALAALALWTALSAAWSADPDTSMLEAQRTLLYAVAVAAALLVRGALLVGTLVGLALVCAYSIAERLVNGPPDPPDPFEGTLLHEPLGYANALAALAAFGIAIVVGSVVAAPRRRLALGLLLAPLVAALVLTGSRGGVLAAAAGVAVAVALATGRVRVAQALAGVAGAGLALALALPAGSLADDLAADAGFRSWYWHVAWAEAAESPVAGRGAGTFELAWLERQPIPEAVRDAHSLYLETLAELGLAGLALLVVALAPPLLTALREPRLAGAAGGYVAFCFHAGLDWDWELPAVTLAGLLCGCAALLESERNQSNDPVE